MSVRGLIAGGMSPTPGAADADEGVGGGGGRLDCAPAPYAVEDTTTVDDELAEADDETEDELPDPVGLLLLLLLEGGTADDDKGGSGAVGPSLSDTILVAFVAAELPPMPPPPAPRPDASLLDALRMPKYEETLIPDEDEDSALIDE